MAFFEGNEYWKIRSKDGRDKIFETPEDLLNACNEYFEWVQENPLIEVDFRGKDSDKVNLPKMRAMTLEGLCNFLDIAVNTFRAYENRPDFLHITTRARQIIENQQFEGAASGFLNPNIIARKLGLKESIDHTIGERKAVDELFPTNDELKDGI